MTFSPSQFLDTAENGRNGETETSGGGQKAEGRRQHDQDRGTQRYGAEPSAEQKRPGGQGSKGGVTR
jgi:hypothetical protein